ncbi:PhnD/SsuA/transferrin family substrate-binding protein [Nocardioides panacis]|uniref:PhnD/SsuA/transferrin family substrate-binding protein n=1 Tax=Nocardioides panacis TaxID=2849501 RepID=A0A975T068_9ACTN|nr:tripartite tricarboxylate transporter substrate-binding protein [Nocardioides panacis]QWZ09164.1 PhnD/SsuA/transferrin family substrate-binding protein [Nocardioides panacis]
MRLPRTSHRLLRPAGGAALVAGLALVASACGVTDSSGGDSAADAGQPLSDLRIMVPNTPGGGYDITARTAAKVMEDDEITSGTEVFNLEGAGGTVGLARTVNEKGNADLTMLMGLGVVGASYTNNSKATLAETTPIARLIEEYGAVMVPKGSPFKTIDDLVTAWKADPGSISVGGGSSPGGPDHLLPMQLAQAVGINPKKVNFVQYDGGGDLLPAILGSKVDVATSGAGEFKDQIANGDIRVLATSGDERIDDIDAPTFKEAGIDLVFTNWRGVVAPPGITDAEKERLVGIFQKMHETQEWKDALKANSWADAFQTSDQFGAFLTEQDKRVADTLSELGLA